MKKLVSFLLSLTMSLTLVGCVGQDKDKPVLKVFNWGEYADMYVVRRFEKEFQCKVIYETFDSNEAMYTKLLGGNSYDVMVPSEYMIERLVKEDLLQKIDWSQIEYKESLNTAVLNQEFDKENEYWVPYFYGNVGILYDKTKVSKEDLNAGWEILRNPKYKGQIYMYDTEREAFLVALKALGYSMNTTDENEISQAYQWLVDQKKSMNPTYATDDMIDAMKNGEKVLAEIYSGDAAAVIAENEDMDFYMPSEGTNIWFDGFVVSKDCQNYDLAMKFINYMISDENALNNTLEVGYLTTNVKAAKEAKIEDFQGNTAYDVRMNENDEIFAYQPQNIKEIYSRYYTKVKAQ